MATASPEVDKGNDIMYILGINGNLGRGTHDPAAFLLRNGEVVCAAEEERFTRVKHSMGRLPENAIRFCLRASGLQIREVDALAFPQESWGKLFDERFRSHMRLRFGYCPPVFYYSHHLAHAASTYYGSGYDEALILTLDGSGDGVSCGVYLGRNGRIQESAVTRFPDSLGIYYGLVTQFLGFAWNNDEHKIMSLASYGEPSVDLSDLLSLDGHSFQLNRDFLSEFMLRNSFPHFITDQEPLFNERFVSQYGRPRLADQPVGEREMNFAASAQDHLNRLMCEFASRWMAQSIMTSLCLAGGVALNCVMNGKLRALPALRRLYVPPVANDTGTALGAAMLCAIEHGISISPISHPYFGDGYSDDEIRHALIENNIRFTESADAIEELVAERIVSGKIVGWFQGRMEIGPRALGNRSLLGDARQQATGERINAKIKKRSWFQPFAPSVTREDASRFFVEASDSPFMTVVYDVNRECEEVIPAVVHVDRTARVQTVSKETNPRYYDLLRAIEAYTGVPVVLNTSLNRRGEPIARSPEDALSVLYGTGIDGMALGSCYVEKG